MGKKQDRIALGNLGEIRSQLFFTQKNYEVYSPNIGNTYYDFIVAKARNMKEAVVKTVEVKSTASRNVTDTGWRFNIGKSFMDLPFDNTKVDYLCLYIGPLDKIVLLDAKKVTQKVTYTLQDKQIEIIDNTDS